MTMTDGLGADHEGTNSGNSNIQLSLADAFERHRERLILMVRLRMDHRLQGRVDATDVLQEAFIECAKRYASFQANPTMPLFLWVRLQTSQKLVDLHRYHLGVRMRDAGRDISLSPTAMPKASSVSLAAQLLGRLTSASHVAIRAETQTCVQDALERMDPIDREVLTLRHFEMLTNEETSQVLGIKKSAASNRYIRALSRLKEIIAEIPGLDGT
jgi:RNA polymerase sigma-70 factor (ECF subfamily)